MARAPLLPRAVDLAGTGDVGAALETLHRERTFDLQAAYASAVRRRTEPGHAAAAELLEIALLARQRGLLRGARWYHRPELVVGIWIVSQGINLSVRAGKLGWPQALVPAVLTLTVAIVAVVLLRRAARRTDVPAVSVGDHQRVEFARLSDTVAAVVAHAEAGGSTDELVAVAERHARGVGATVVAAAGLARAERLLMMGGAAVGPFRAAAREAVPTVAAAREQLRTRLAAEHEPLLDRLR